jgi:hypothetical protein
MAGVAATLLFSAGGAGGIALTYWALRKAGMRRRDVARRMVAFISLHYAFYPLALIVCGILLRTGVVNGADSIELTIIPAGVAGVMLVVGLLIALIPADVERRLMPFARGEKARSFVRSVAKVPETVGEGFRFAMHLFANLFPLAPAGVGAVDAGMIGAFVLFGLPEETVFPAILIFRLVAFWLPIPPGIVAFFQLRKTVHRWETEGRPIERGGTAKSDFEPAMAGVASEPEEGYYQK